MAKTKIIEGLNKQINAELYSSYLYLSMAAWLGAEGFPGAAHWMNIQAREENMHGMKIYNYMLERGFKVELKTIEGPQIKWVSFAKVFEDALAHEKLITASINQLVVDARKELDFATEFFLHWFVTEQVEEENNVTEILDKLKLAENNKQNLLYIDDILASRVETTIVAEVK